MMSIELLFPPHFPALVMAHLVALLSPGPDFFLLTAYALRHGLRGSVGICIGIALGNGVYILLATLGWAGMQHMPRLFSLIQLAGALYLLWIGFMLLRSTSGPTTLLATTEPGMPSLWRQLMLGLGSSLLNPKNMLFYFSLMTSILGPSVTVTQQIISGSWLFSAVLLWDMALVSLIGHAQIQHRLLRFLSLIERGAGGILMLFGVILLLHH